MTGEIGAPAEEAKPPDFAGEHDPLWRARPIKVEAFVKGSKRRLVDTLWLRVDDVAATLAARRYARDGVLGLAIDGERWELVVDGGRARCQRTDAPAALALDRAALGSLVLGTVPASTLGRAGRASGAASALAAADALFAWPIAPWCPEQF